MTEAHPSPLATWPPAWAPSAVVFDCDGLLLDTESVWQSAQDTVVAARGAVLDPLGRTLGGKDLHMLDTAARPVVEAEAGALVVDALAGPVGGSAGSAAPG